MRLTSSSYFQTRVQQLEVELLRRHALESSDGNDASLDALGDSMMTTQQDSVKLLKQLLGDARRQMSEEKEVATAERIVLADVIWELDEEMGRVVNQNRLLVAAVGKQQEKIQKMQGELSQAQIEKLMLENDNALMNAAGRLASSAKETTSNIFSRLKIAQ